MVRIKHRYLLFNILYPNPPQATTQPSSQPPSYVLFSRPSPNHLTSQLLISTIRSNIQSIFGDYGVSVTQSGMRIVYFSPGTSTVILRVPRAHFRLVWASLTFMDTLPVRVVRVSGTIRKSEEEVLRRARREIVRAKREGRDADDDQDVLESLVVESKGKARATANTLRTQGEVLDMEDLDEDDIMDDISD
ncbi:RNA-binding protein pop5 [Elasticomyces elasticus]|uniref:Ribonuclease P/MRP protein subunit POP5 n=1 Tax=Exophiala sideris TaxID=1016849 RepID=A0ABR0JIF6_9EURO|nr:RNA-binding protein pop5 [Elasticomyces elasticus]KAK5034387.1 RNA-binding protein pop5 [Exophiala sideris]KAK5042684.1 RNA-binding protein pop5 [Exophiala sideris]KAK5065766.1 RNA-binding protein pop5 [Exophiala sideris]